MSLCRTVSILAKEIESQLNNLSDSERRMLEVMKNMPSYLNSGNLSQWEADYRASMNDEDEERMNFRIIELLYELPGLNLFGALDAKKTKSIYSFIVQELTNNGIKVSEGLDVHEW
jgi:hypothetical protein